MRYEFVVLPVGAVASPGEVAGYLRAQQGIPVDDQLRLLAAGLRMWNEELPVSARRAVLHVEAAGMALRVTPADVAERWRPRGSGLVGVAGAIRSVLELLVDGLGYQLYDAENGTLWTP
ncbi:hypothetical protein [Nocardia sp. NPDC020380]|uniref:hypothetical protein n=1 Tax=Nocardia sp. NPDC020380 TaxID=3364309 RepID=UPI0037B979CC